MRRTIIYTIFAVLLSVLSYSPILITPIQAADNIFDLLKKSERHEAMSQFCEKRSTDQINLETWYSGKCKTDGSSQFTGDAVGFSDIIFLDLIEKVSGPVDPQKSPLQLIIDFLTTIKKVIEAGKLTSEAETDQFIYQAFENLKQDLIDSNKNSLVGQVSSHTHMLATTTPTRTSEYIQYVAQNIKQKIEPDSVYAATTGGYGYNGFVAFLPLWRGMRNAVFILISLVFVAYGFMIMFRVNIAPKISASVSNLIPKIITVMLLVTFSYAIVGFVIDIMYFLYYVFVYIMISSNVLTSGELCKPHGCLPSVAGGRIGMIPAAIVQNIVANLSAPIAISNTLLGGSDWFGVAFGIFGLVTGYGLVLGFVLTIAIFIGFIKLWVKLIQALISLVISIMFAPLIIFMDLIPGSEGASGKWFKNVVGNASCFLVAQVLLTLSYIFMMQPLINIISILPPEFTNLWGVVNLASGIGTDHIAYVPFTSLLPMTVTGLYALIGLGILLMASKYVDMVRDFFNISGFKYGSAITESLQGGWDKAKGKWVESRLNKGTGTAVYSAMQLKNNKI
jgi:hypothetical protein